jgi:TRAP-type C4-dicarboxylate transport system substrate-binding protein
MKSVLRFAIAGLALAWAGQAVAQTTTLRIGNWLPGHHLIPRGIVEPWARAIERESNGSLKLEIMPSAIGRPPEYFDFVVNGVVDIGYGVSGHNPGRFTMTQVMDLPFMSPDPWGGAAAAWSTYERYGARYGEHKGAKVLGLWVHSEPDRKSVV